MWHTLITFNTLATDEIPTVVSCTNKLSITDWLEERSIRPWLFRSFKPENTVEYTLEIDVNDEIWQKYQTKENS
jgi:outer membrane protease